MIYLDRNENLYGPAPQCYEALKRVGVELLSVYSRDFSRGVKSALTERLAAELQLPEAQILLSEGSEDMLKQLVHCYMGPGERMLCPAHSWWYYQKVASEVAGETITYALHIENDSFAYNVDEILRLYERESPRLVLIASPNNPTGHSLHESDLSRLTEACRESIIVVDEAYWGFAERSNDHLSPLVHRYRNLVVLRTFSKYYALAGARIAYAAVGLSLTRLTKFASRYLGYNRISEALALAALDSREYYEDIAERMCRDRKRYYDFFDRYPDCTCYRSDANFILVRIPPTLRSAVQATLQARQIQIKFFDEPGFSDCVRITLGTEQQNSALLDALAEVFSSRAQR